MTAEPNFNPYWLDTLLQDGRTTYLRSRLAKTTLQWEVVAYERGLFLGIAWMIGDCKHPLTPQEMAVRNELRFLALYGSRRFQLGEP